MPVFELKHDYPQKFRYYDMLVSAFVAVLLISNIVAPKLVEAGPLLFSGAQLLFPVTYIFGDIFTEVYGYAGSRRAIWNGFLASALMAGVALLIVDRKSTRLNSSHSQISYAVFCLRKKKETTASI